MRKILVDGNVTLFLVAPSACHRFYTQWACQRNPIATPIAASVQNLNLPDGTHVPKTTACQRDLYRADIYPGQPGRLEPCLFTRGMSTESRCDTYRRFFTVPLSI